jgi:hypothetical protein
MVRGRGGEECTATAVVEGVAELVELERERVQADAPVDVVVV